MIRQTIPRGPNGAIIWSPEADAIALMAYRGEITHEEAAERTGTSYKTIMKRAYRLVVRSDRPTTKEREAAAAAALGGI